MQRKSNIEADELAKARYCKILGAECWDRNNPPSYYFKVWQSHLDNANISYPWDNMRYHQQKEAYMWMTRFIYDIYKEIRASLSPQLIIEF